MKKKKAADICAKMTMLAVIAERGCAPSARRGKRERERERAR